MKDSPIDIQRLFNTIDEITRDFADKLNAGLEDSFTLTTKGGNVATGLADIAQAIRSLARAVRGEQDQAGRESDR